MPHYWEEAKKCLAERDAVLARVMSHYHGEILKPKGDAFYTLARSIVGQQISVKAADSVWRKFENLLEDISPHSLQKQSDEKLRACGLSASKVRYLQDLSRYFLENPNVEAELKSLPDAEVEKSLISIKGIGKWSAEMFLIFYLARPDIFPIADIGLQKAIFRHYNNSEKMLLENLTKISENWKPYRTVATWYLWRSLDPVPVEY